jgi:hypothetical protein
MMKNSVIVAVVTTLALGVIATQPMRIAVATVEPDALAQAISPFDMMQNARGLPVQAHINAI